MINIGRVQVSRPNELCVNCPFLWWKEHQLSCPFLWRKEHQLSCPLQGCNEHNMEVKSVAPCGDMTTKWILLYEQNKNPIKTDGWNNHMKDKREGQMMGSPLEPKKGENYCLFLSDGPLWFAHHHKKNQSLNTPKINGLCGIPICETLNTRPIEHYRRPFWA